MQDKYATFPGMGSRAEVPKWNDPESFDKEADPKRTSKVTTATISTEIFGTAKVSSETVATEKTPCDKCGSGQASSETATTLPENKLVKFSKKFKQVWASESLLSSRGLAIFKKEMPAPPGANADAETARPAQPIPKKLKSAQNNHYAKFKATKKWSNVFAELRSIKRHQSCYRQKCRACDWDECPVEKKGSRRLSAHRAYCCSLSAVHSLKSLVFGRPKKLVIKHPHLEGSVKEIEEHDVSASGNNTNVGEVLEQPASKSGEAVVPLNAELTLPGPEIACGATEPETADSEVIESETNNPKVIEPEIAEPRSNSPVEEPFVPYDCGDSPVPSDESIPSEVFTDLDPTDEESDAPSNTRPSSSVYSSDIISNNGETPGDFDDSSFQFHEAESYRGFQSTQNHQLETIEEVDDYDETLEENSNDAVSQENLQQRGASNVETANSRGSENAHEIDTGEADGLEGGRVERENIDEEEEEKITENIDEEEENITENIEEEEENITENIEEEEEKKVTENTGEEKEEEKIAESQNPASVEIAAQENSETETETETESSFSGDNETIFVPNSTKDAECKAPVTINSLRSFLESRAAQIKRVTTDPDPEGHPIEPELEVENVEQAMVSIKEKLQFGRFDKSSWVRCPKSDWWHELEMDEVVVPKMTSGAAQDFKFEYNNLKAHFSKSMVELNFNRYWFQREQRLGPERRAQISRANEFSLKDGFIPFQQIAEIEMTSDLSESKALLRQFDLLHSHDTFSGSSEPDSAGAESVCNQMSHMKQVIFAQDRIMAKCQQSFWAFLDNFYLMERYIHALMSHVKLLAGQFHNYCIQISTRDKTHDNYAHIKLCLLKLINGLSILVQMDTSAQGSINWLHLCYKEKANVIFRTYEKAFGYKLVFHEKFRATYKHNIDSSELTHEEYDAFIGCESDAGQNLFLKSCPLDNMLSVFQDKVERLKIMHLMVSESRSELQKTVEAVVSRFVANP